MTITVEQIKSIIAGAEETLRLLQNQPEYQEIESSEKFVTQNELGLADAIQALSEVYQAITESECDLLISSLLIHQWDSNLPKQRKLFRELVG
jgi:hypothetical protein